MLRNRRYTQRVSMTISALMPTSNTMHSICIRCTTFTPKCTYSQWDPFRCIGNERIHFEPTHSTRCISSSNFVITPKPIGCPICVVIYSSFDVWLFRDNYMGKCMARRCRLIDERTQNLIRAFGHCFPCEIWFRRRETTAAIDVIKWATGAADEARCRNTPIGGWSTAHGV